MIFAPEECLFVKGENVTEVCEHGDLDRISYRQGTALKNRQPLSGQEMAFIQESIAQRMMITDLKSHALLQDIRKFSIIPYKDKMWNLSAIFNDYLIGYDKPTFGIGGLVHLTETPESDIYEATDTDDTFFDFLDSCELVMRSTDYPVKPMGNDDSYEFYRDRVWNMMKNLERSYIMLLSYSAGGVRPGPNYLVETNVERTGDYYRNPWSLGTYRLYEEHQHSDYNYGSSSWGGLSTLKLTAHAQSGGGLTFYDPTQLEIEDTGEYHDVAQSIDLWLTVLASGRGRDGYFERKFFVKAVSLSEGSTRIIGNSGISGIIQRVRNALNVNLDPRAMLDGQPLGDTSLSLLYDTEGHNMVAVLNDSICALN